MMALNAAPDFEAGYRLVAERVPGLTLEEFAGSMEMMRQIVLAQMEKARFNKQNRAWSLRNPLG